MTLATQVAVVFLAVSSLGMAADGRIAGRVTDPQGKPVAGARVRVTDPRGRPLAAAISGAEGEFEFSPLEAGGYQLEATAPNFGEIRRNFRLEEGEALTVDLPFARVAARTDNLTVTADAAQVDLEHPDPGQVVNVREDILDANPGRPGAPVSIPGLPVETASSGIKAPQYFAPGVAGDHGEPIAQFFQVGSYLAPNNLSANAHGNGYADPNVIVPAIIESVETDGGAFNVREGDHSVNLAADYGLHSRLEPFVTLTGDYRDVNVAAGWSPANPGTRAWIAIEASYGNGFLDALEHRRQFKLNAFRVLEAGNHTVTLFGIGYYGQSKVPGLVPIDVPNLHDTIDPRQQDQTHTGEIALNDLWRVLANCSFPAYFRTYNLALYSDFGDGLIRQERVPHGRGRRGGIYIRKLADSVTLMAGTDYNRDAPRRDDLDHYLSTDPAVYGPFEKVTANNVTIGILSPFLALDGSPWPWLRYYAAWRRDEIQVDNTDLLNPPNSFNKLAGVNSPKATLSLLPPEKRRLPTFSASFGDTFFTNDPRIGAGALPALP